MSNEIVYPKGYPLEVWEEGEKVTIAKVKEFFDLDKNRKELEVKISLFSMDIDDIYPGEFPAAEVGSRFNSYLEKILKISLSNKYPDASLEKIYTDIKSIYLNLGIQGVMKKCVVEIEVGNTEYPYFEVKYVSTRLEEDSEVALRIANRLRAYRKKVSDRKAAERRKEASLKERRETYLKLKKEFEGE